MESDDKAEKNGVARLRERFYEIKRSIKVPAELEEAIKKERPVVDKKKTSKDDKKIASPNPRKDLDL